MQVQGPLTTDGVHDHVAPQFLLSTPQSGQGLPETADILISNAIEAGSKDDMSVVLARILGRIDCGRSIFEHTH